MVGVAGLIIIALMTTDTFWGKPGIGAIGMALGTILQIMALGQWEKVVVYTFGIPTKPKRIMTFNTIGGIPGSCMVRILRTCIIILMTTDTIVSDPIKTQRSFGGMAFDTTQITVRTYQWKTVCFMQFGNIIHQPGFRTVALGTIIPYRLAMYIGVA